MKKFLNLLLILALLGGMFVSLPDAAAVNSLAGNTKARSLGIKSSGNDSLAGGVIKNYYNPMFQMAMVRPEDGNFDFAMNSEGTDLYLHRVVVAYYNYEDGATESEADEKIAELGNGELSWGTVVYDFAMNAFPQNSIYGGSAQKIGLDGQAIESLSLAEVNKSDVLYYAAEFGEKSGAGLLTTWSNSTWVRGKIDYRDCIHGSNYTNYGECKIVRTGDDETVNYWTYGRAPAADVHIMTWAEEWRKMQSDRLQAIEDKIIEWEGLENFSEVESEEIDDISGKLEKLKLTLSKTEGAEELMEWRDDLAKRLRKLQGLDDAVSGGEGDDDGNIDNGDVENKDNEEMEDGSQGNMGGSNSEVVGNINDNWGAVTEGTRVRGKTDSVSMGGLNSVAEAGNGKDAYGGNLGAENTEEESVDKKNVQDSQDATGIGVPKLGEEEKKINVWVILLPMLAGFCWLILVVLRRIWRKMQASDN